MEVGSGMLYSVSVVDGLVHQLGGWPLRMEIKLLPTIQEPDEKCPVGSAVVTSCGFSSDLSNEYDYVVHTVPPFYKHHPDPNECLRNCYRSSFAKAFDLTTTNNRVATPLLGAGARGFPLDVAVDVAASESIFWLSSVGDNSITERYDSSGGDDGIYRTVAFGIPDEKTAELMVEALTRHNYVSYR